MTAMSATSAGPATAPAPAGHASVLAERMDDAAALERLRALLDPAFLGSVGWDATTQVLTPPADHPQLGFGVCTVAGCLTPTNRGDRMCATCGRQYQASGMPLDQFRAAGPSKARTFGEFACAVPGCGRPHEVTTMRLCSTHRWQRQQLGVTLEAFLCRPDVRPFPSLGGCLVACCTRTAATRRRLCRPHEMRWRKRCRAHPRLDDADLDFDDWCRHTPPVVEGRAVVLRGLPSLLQAQLLYGLQERSRGGSKTKLPAVRRLVERLRQAKVRSIFDVEPLRVPPRQRLPELDRFALDVRNAVTRAFATVETERHKDRWDLRAFGHRGTLDFTVIAQPWLRAAIQVWAGETMPRRRGDGVAGILRDHIRSVGELAASLERHRADRGADLTRLSRADVVSFLNRLKHLEATGEMSAHQRMRTCRRAGQVLRECRELGLTRQGQPLAGLPDDFTIRRNDCPREPEVDEPGRALPASVLRQLCAGLERLEQRCGTTVRTGVELLMDTGRRPDEVCALPWDCLDRDSDGKHVLVYANFKENRLGRRLPIADATARLISAQQQRVRTQFPTTPVEDLALLPRATRNPRGTHPIKDHHLSETHRRWVDALPPLLLESAQDGKPPAEFPKAAAVPYAYRHSYAQRHADAGTPIDVLRDLMDHRSMTATQVYYRVTATRTRTAVDRLAAHQFDGHGQRVWQQARALLEHEHQRHAVGQVAVPFGICTEPSNVQAGGGACPFRFRCVGCGHFRTDPSYLPELRDYLDTLLRNRERVRAAVELDDWARAEAMPSDQEITRLRQLIRKVEHDLKQLGDTERQQVDEACRVVRATRQTVHLGMPTIRPPDPDPALETPA